MANTLMSIGHTFFLESKWQDAVGTYIVAREHWINSGQVFGECQSLIWLGEAQRKSGHLDDAERYLLEAARRYEAMKAPFTDMARAGLADVYERLSANSNEAGRGEASREYAQRARRYGSTGPVQDKPL
jgi:hypothetical protein